MSQRWAKRMDDAVESMWLRNLRLQARAAGQAATPQRLMAGAPRAKAPLAKLDRSVAAAADR